MLRHCLSSAIAAILACGASVGLAEDPPRYQLSSESGPMTVQENGLTWFLRLDEAQQAAQQDGRPLFVLFTGSDWCGWCMKLEDEVFEDATFASQYGSQYHFVKIDSPHYATLPPELDSYYDELHETYDIEGYPTVVILNPQGEKQGELSYVKGGVPAFGKALKNISSPPSD